ncbi:MAG: SurA N-terminal domain-containing protein [Gammaproteobacteria bacterium]|jgi:peptidyl-prolyl cis-trans isomerase D|nr:SurA N-terminal domain-containing protein [Gammaproteobacteria bacterium]
MLEAIRQRFTGWIAILVISLIALTLVISFGNMDQTPLEDDVVITVNDTEITLFEYREEYSNKLAELQQVFGDEVPEILDQTIKESATEDLILRALLLDYMSKNGYRVSPEYVVELITNNPGLQVGGIFDRQNYEAILASQGVSVEQFESDLRLQLQINQLRRGFIDTSFITPNEFRQFIELQMQKRIGQLLTINSEDFIGEVVIDADQIQLYFDNNQDLFQTDEEVDVEYLSLSLDDVAATIEYSEDDLRDYYEDNLARFITNEERKSRHILIAIDEDTNEEDALETILNVQERLASESFDEIAKEFSDDPGSAELGGDLGWAEPGLFVPEFDKVLFSLEVNELSDPVKTDFGYHLIRLDELKEGQQQEYQDIQPELDSEYSKLLAEDKLFGLADQLADLSLQAFNELNSVADSLGLSLSRIDGVSRNGATFFNQDPEIISILFSQNSIETSENTPLFELDDSIFVARVIGHRIPTTRDFSDVESGIKDYLASQEAISLANNYAELIKPQFSDNASFEGNAGELNIEASEFDVSRGDTELSRGLVEMIFNSSSQDMAEGTIQTYIEGEKVFLIRVNNYEDGRLELFNDEERNSAKLELSEQIGSRELNAFAEHLRKNAEVSVDPGLYSGLFDL